MGRAEKEERVRGLAERLRGAQAAVLTDYRGLTVLEAAELRQALDEADTRFSIVKNSLTLLAVKEAGLEGLSEFVDGPTAIAFILGDPVAGAKKLVAESKRLPVLEVRGGFAEGRIMTAEEVKAFAALASRPEMLAQLAGLGKMQMSRAAFMFQALQSKFLSLMGALKDKLPAEEAPAAPAEDPPAEEAPAEEAAAPPAAEDNPDPERPGSGEPEPAPDEPAEPAETETEPAREAAEPEGESTGEET
jgi:large subunit ribosomal protein L10